MGERITVVGGTDSSIAVTLDGSQAMDLAHQFASELDNYYKNNQLNFLDVTESPNVNDQQGYGVVTAGGAYSAGNGYNYLVVGGYNARDPLNYMTPTEVNAADILNAPVTINSVMNSSQFVRVLAGNMGGFVYNAGEESGQLASGNASNNITFNGNTVNGGNWVIATGRGDDKIVTGSGNNTVYASTGNNDINITSGNRNEVLSEGKDSIYASHDSTAQNRVTLTGGSSQDNHATVDLNKGASVIDLSYYNTVTVGGGSTVEGGTYGSYTFDGSYDSNISSMNNGTSSSITATGDLLVVHGNANTITATKDLTFLNGIGDTETNLTGGQINGFGAGGLNYTLNVTGGDTGGGFFVADAGNETLNASGSTSGLQIYANTVVGGDTTFVATGGSGNDTLVAGTGQSTFAGGQGDNLFMFTKDVADNGNTVITDFSKDGSNDKIALFNYGLDDNSLQALLDNSKNDANGNAVLNLDGHTITIQGVAVSDLTVSQFEVANAPAKS